MFSVPIDGSTPVINWMLIKYDIIIIDEVGMVSSRILRHVLNSIQSLPVPPVYLFLGDRAQQSPLDSVDGITATTTNIFTCSDLIKHCDRFVLHQQHRLLDPGLNQLLHIMSQSYINHDQLEMLNSRCKFEEPVCARNIIATLNDNPDTTFVTITRKGSRFINSVIIDHLFGDQPVMCTVPGEGLVNIDLYENLPILITHNINKHHGIVNGAEATIVSTHNGLIFIRLMNGSCHFLYPLMCDESGEEYFPIIQNYSLTIFKVQGRTLDNISVWLDRSKPTPGAAYVAFSRVHHLRDINLLEPINRFQVTPIKTSRDENLWSEEIEE